MAKKKDVPMTYFNHNGMELEIEESDLMKYEIAEEIGVLDKAIEGGWKSLSARESGRIGGIISKRRRLNRENLN